MHTSADLYDFVNARTKVAFYSEVLLASHRILEERTHDKTLALNGYVMWEARTSHCQLKLLSIPFLSSVLFSPHVKEFKIVLDSRFHAMGPGFHALNSSLSWWTWIPDSNR